MTSPHVFDSAAWRVANPLPEEFPINTRFCDTCQVRVMVVSGQHIDDDGNFGPFVEGVTVDGFCPICRDFLGSYFAGVALNGVLA